MAAVDTLLKYSNPVLVKKLPKLRKEKEPKDLAKQEILDNLLPPR